MCKKGDTMKILYALPVLMALPISAFAESDSYHIKPFVGYNIYLANNINMKIKDSGRDAVKVETIGFNEDNTGDFVFGVEIADVVAISLNPSINKVKTTVTGTGSTTSKMNEIDAEVDIYLNRGKSFKPYIALNAGYISMDGDFKASGASFGAGVGVRQYINNNVYLNALLEYNTTTEMSVKEVSGTPVSDVDMRMSGFNFIIGAGYRF